MGEMRLLWRRMVAPVGAALVLAACGSGSNPTTTTATPTPTAVPCTQTVLLQGADSLAPKTAGSLTFTTATTGRVDAFLDWTFADSIMGLFVYRGTCNVDQFNAGTCDFLISEVSPPKPLKASAANVAPGTYGLILANGSSVQEALSASVILSTGSCPAASSVSSTSRTRLPALRGESLHLLRR
jgi:hypothetical protein